MRNFGFIVIAIAISVSTTGCAMTQDFVSDTRHLLERGLERPSLKKVKPWERDILAREDMAWQPDGLKAQRRTHIYFSKESSLVGGTAGGGGCGCN